MSRRTYRVGEVEYQFSSASFDALVRSLAGHGTYFFMRSMASALGFSLSSIKDWHSGYYAPDDLCKVNDLARYLHVNRSVLLSPSDKELEMSVALNDREAEGFFPVYREIVDFFELVDATDQLVWHEYDLLGLAPSLVRDVVPSRLYPPSIGQTPVAGPMGVTNFDLHDQVSRRARRVLSEQKARLGTSPVYAELDAFVDEYIEMLPYDDDGEWVPDPDLLFEPSQCFSPSPMALKRAEAGKVLDAMCRRYLGCK